MHPSEKMKRDNWGNAELESRNYYLGSNDRHGTIQQSLTRNGRQNIGKD